jgi:hypothetical protein
MYKRSRKKRHTVYFPEKDGAWNENDLLGAANLGDAL